MHRADRSSPCSPAALHPISPGVDEQIWTFVRDGHQLEIRRTPTETGILVGIHGDGAPRMSLFTDLDRLDAFQADFEKFLLATGWSFIGFSPERRTGQERRHYSRLLTDRRRWWTDGVRTDASREADGREQEDRRRRRQPRRAGPR
jgi:hypothetical protein